MKYTLIILALLLSDIAFAQHDMHNMHDMAETRDTAAHMQSPGHHNMAAMSSAQSLSLPMNRNGSGTSWLPDAAPMYGYMTHAGKWMFMFHGDIFIRYNRQDIFNAGNRGGEKWDAPDMLMGMAQRRIGRNGLLRFNAMFSTDAIIAGGSGYPLLFQTGESWQGKPLVDRQHPHDLFSELSVSYAYRLSPKADLSLYLGYPGEPALGAPVFMHRPAGLFIPDAPISHHWVDATHITFGVATLGLRYGKFRLEGSSFTGREPGENRYNFDPPLFDSWSGRLLFNPSSHWALQLSHGFIKSPEQLHPVENINRSTASVTYVYPFTLQSYFSATALWGQNIIPHHEASNAALFEAMAKLRKWALYTRYEWVQKSAEELVLFSAPAPDVQYSVNALTLGAGYDLVKAGPVIIAVGGQLSLSHATALSSLYGDYPVGGQVYMHIYPMLVR